MLNNRRTILCQFLGLIGAGFAVVSGRTVPAAAQGNALPVVVELFTSQGCSSCPPAEALLSELAQRQDVIALEFHVDYWDYIGWKDPFADPAFTERQRRYNRAFGSPYNYTPQMVVDGRDHEVGSRRSAVEARIETASMKREMAREQMTTPPEMSIARSADGTLTVTLSGDSPEQGAFEILVVGFDKRHETEVQRGENRGRKLINAHVVRSAETLTEQWHGGDMSLSVPAARISGDGGCAVLVQNPQTGTIAVAGDVYF